MTSTIFRLVRWARNVQITNISDEFKGLTFSQVLCTTAERLCKNVKGTWYNSSEGISYSPRVDNALCLMSGLLSDI